MTQTSHSGRTMRPPAEVIEAHVVNLGSVDWGRCRWLDIWAGGGLAGGGGGVIKLGNGVDVTGNWTLFDMDELVSDLEGLSKESEGLF